MARALDDAGERDGKSHASEDEKPVAACAAAVRTIPDAKDDRRHAKEEAEPIEPQLEAIAEHLRSIDAADERHELLASRVRNSGGKALTCASVAQ